LEALKSHPRFLTLLKQLKTPS
ncbi:MAG: hypothetical protein RLZZ162_666, partial [Verrucomicrobiota bacterium]